MGSIYSKKRVKKKILKRNKALKGKKFTYWERLDGEARC